MAVVDLKNRAKRRYSRTPRDLVPIDKTTGPARYFHKMIREIQFEYGGKRELSRIEEELIEAFAGCAVALKYQTHEILLGEAELDLSGYATMASTMLRIGSRLGLQRRMKTLPTLDEFLTQRARANGEPTKSEVIDDVEDIQ